MMGKWKVGMLIYFISSLMMIFYLQNKCYLNEDRKLNGELIYQMNSSIPAGSCFYSFIRSPEEYERFLKSIDMYKEPNDFNIYNFDFENQILVISSRHKINYFTYKLNSKRDSASHLCIAVPVFDFEETDSYFYYIVPSGFTSVSNSKSYIGEGIKFN